MSPLSLLAKKRKKKIEKRNKTRQTLSGKLEIMILWEKRKKITENTIIA